ncbi:Uncharacterised protein [Providencia stuartii]|nr:Uncharacterised protein [Providencia stuartii]
MLLLRSLWLITIAVLPNHLGMILMFIVSLILMMILMLFFTWREPRRVSKSLAVQYDKMLYLIEDSSASRKAIGKYIEV